MSVNITEIKDIINHLEWLVQEQDDELGNYLHECAWRLVEITRPKEEIV